MCENHSNAEFKLITYKRPRKPHKIDKIPNSSVNLDKDVILSRILEAKNELKSSDLLASALASLREGLSTLSHPKITELVCFGLGHIGECLISRYQLAFLLILSDVYEMGVKVYDPVFSELDLWLLRQFDVEILTDNFEGKFRVNDRATRIFYLPHCPKQLTNNLLWANWGLNLTYCIIISNSFNAILENTPGRSLNKSASYVASIVPHMTELALINSFRLFEVFNDTAIHIFPFQKISLISEDFWEYNSEPMGKVATLKQILSELRSALPGGNLKQNLAVQYILSQYRKYKTTSEQLCKDREEMEYMANTYLCYLKSLRLHQEIHQEFHGKGERSVRETANLVGFKLPHDPK